MATATYNKNGAKATTPAKLDKSVFGVGVDNHELLKQAYVTYLANGRNNLAVSKQRGEVRGGGRKPWKQKGTGRARFGSTRNPIWRGGGVAFGPTGDENYSLKMNQKAKHNALRQALSAASSENQVIVIEDFLVKDGKTAQATSLLSKIGANGRILLVVDSKSPELTRATANIQDVKLVTANYVNVYDLINADFVVITSKGLAALTEWLSPQLEKLSGGEK